MKLRYSFANNEFHGPDGDAYVFVNGVADCKIAFKDMVIYEEGRDFFLDDDGMAIPSRIHVWAGKINRVLKGIVFTGWMVAILGEIILGAIGIIKLISIL